MRPAGRTAFSASPRTRSKPVRTVEREGPLDDRVDVPTAHRAYVCEVRRRRNRVVGDRQRRAGETG